MFSEGSAQPNPHCRQEQSPSPGSFYSLQSKQSQPCDTHADVLTQVQHTTLAKSDIKPDGGRSNQFKTL